MQNWILLPVDPALWSWVATNDYGNIVYGASSTSGIFKSSDYGATFSATQASTLVPWTSITTSDGGNYLVASGSNSSLYWSTDGYHWDASNAPILNWTSVSSRSSARFVAASSSQGGIYYSDSWGETWEATSADNETKWVGVAISYDGLKLGAVTPNQRIYYSTDGGKVWQNSGSYAYEWTCINSIPGGYVLLAGSKNDGVWKSTDWGSHWGQQDVPEDENWVSVGLSSSGMILAAAYSSNGGGIYLSTDYGDTWTDTVAPANSVWTSIAVTTQAHIIYATALNKGMYKCIISLEPTHSPTFKPGPPTDDFASNTQSGKFIAVMVFLSLFVVIVVTMAAVYYHNKEQHHIKKPDEDEKLLHGKEATAPAALVEAHNDI